MARLLLCFVFLASSANGWNVVPSGRGLVPSWPAKFLPAVTSRPRTPRSSPIRYAGDPEPSEDAPTTVDAPTRETADEAWAKAPEGSFLSPAVVGALFLTSLCIKLFVLGGDGPPSF